MTRRPFGAWPGARAIARAAIATAAIVTTAIAAAGARQAPGAGDDEAIAEFMRRVDAYVELHRRIEGPVPTPRISSDAGEIRRAIASLGNAIRKERRTARRGDVFSPEIAAAIQKRIHAGCGGDYDAAHAIAHDEEGPLPPARVNGRWPGGGMTVMPVKVLCELPPLPEELEYRFVNRDLVLWDMHADLVVDIMPGALATRR